MAVGLLQNYLSQNTGRGFETYATCRSDPFNITGDDLVAVTMLSIGINAKTRTGMSPDAVLRLEDCASTINSLLSQLPVHVQLHELSQAQADALMLKPGSPAWARVRYGTPPRF
jgi:hypothetical protein